MAIRFRCDCGQQLRTDDEFAGKMCRCKQCGKKLRIPGAQPAVVAPPAVNEETPRSGRALFLGATILVLFVGVGALILWFVSPRPTTAPAKPPSSPPKLALKVRWQFESGSSGYNPKPNTWKLTLDLKNNDERPWTVLPDLAFGEALGEETLGAGLCLSHRPNVVLRYFTPPNDMSGESREFVKVADDWYSLGYPLTRQWMHNGAPHRWEPTELKPGEAIQCIWTDASATTFKNEVKADKGYSLFHLGPVIYDPRYPSVPAYAYTAQIPGAQKNWELETAEPVPLTSANLLRQMDDVSKPTAWRHHFQEWLSGQPRPLPTNEVNAILLRVLDKRHQYPLALRMSAGRNLVFGGHTARGRVLELAATRGEHPGLRCYVIEYLKYLKSDGERVLLTLAQDGNELVPVREASLNALAEDRKGRHWPAIEKLREDVQVGKLVTKLVEDRDKKTKELAKKIAEMAQENKVQEQTVKAIATLEGQERLDHIAAELEKWGTRTETEGSAIVGVSFLFFNKATDTGLACLQYLPKLRAVNLNGLPITDAGLEALSGASQLRELTISESRITDAGLAHLKGLTHLEKLDLHDVAITDDGLVHLQSLQRLRKLRLNDVDVTDKGLAALEPLSELCELSLPDQITDAGLASLRPLTKLEMLALSRTQVTDAGLQHLHQLTKLRKLTLSDTAVTNDGVAELQKALPQLEIER